MATGITAPLLPVPKASEVSSPSPKEPSSTAADDAQKLSRAIFVSLTLMIIEIFGGVLANSLAIITDAMHLLSDVGGFAMSLLALHIMRQRATPRYSFGFQQVGALGGLLSVLIVWLMAGALLVQATHRFMAPQAINGELMSAIATMGFLANVVLMAVLGHGHSHGGHGHSHGCGGHGHSGDSGHGHGHGHDEGHSHGHDDKHGHSCGDSHDEGHSHGQSDGHAHGHGSSDAGHAHGNESRRDNHGSHGGHGGEHGHECDGHAHGGDDHGHSHDHGGHGHGSESAGGGHGHGADMEQGGGCCSSGACSSKAKEVSQDHGHAHGHDHHDDDHDGAGEDWQASLVMKAAIIHVIGDMVQSIGVMVAGFLIWLEPFDIGTTPDGLSNWCYADPLCTLVFSILVVLTTIGTIRQAIMQVMLSVPDGIQPEAVKRAILAVPNVVSIHDLHIWQIGDSTVLTGHIIIDQISASMKVLERCTILSQERFNIGHTTFQIEVDGEFDHSIERLKMGDTSCHAMLCNVNDRCPS